MSDEFLIVKAHPNLISFIDKLQKKNAEQLSFYPKCVFEREAENGRLFLGLLNGQPCGYIYVGALRGGIPSVIKSVLNMMLAENFTVHRSS